MIQAYSLARRQVFTAVMMVGLLIYAPSILVGQRIAGNEVDLQAPVISLNSGWYSDRQLVLVSNPNTDGVILVSFDGSDPLIENVAASAGYEVNYYFKGDAAGSHNRMRYNRSFIYDDPLELVERSPEANDLSDIITTYFDNHGINWKKPIRPLLKAHVLKARVFAQGAYSPVVTRTYFIEGARTLTHSLPVISMVGDSEGFFGFDEGIFVGGRRFFERGGNETRYINTGNYRQTGEAFERVAHFEFFEHQASKVSQHLGVRIHGGAARRNPNKGVRLYARRQYDQLNTIDYEVFPGNKSRLGRPITQYRRLMLRNGGDLMDYLTDDVIHRVLNGMNIGTQASRPAVKYVNGEYWGLVNIRDRIDNNYLANHFEVDPDEVIMLNAPWGNSSSANVEYGSNRDVEEYRKLFRLVTEGAIEEKETYSQVTTQLDVLSYIDYVIAFVYFNNVDWYGHKHFRFWKSKIIADKEFQDGKFRLIVWDFDASFKSGAGYNSLENWIDVKTVGNQYGVDDPIKTLFLRSLLRNAEFRALFISRFYDLINSSFEPEVIRSIANKHYEEIEPEFENHMDRWGYFPSSTHQMYSYKNYLNRLISYVNARPSFQRQFLRTAFDLDTDIKITVDISDRGAGRVQVNTILIDNNLPGVSDPVYPWHGMYNKTLPVKVKAIPNPGYQFERWMIDGESVLEDELEIYLSNESNVLAVFSAIHHPERVPVHYWFFDTQLDNNVSIPYIPATYSTTDQAGAIVFYAAEEGSGIGYVDRVNDPTLVNFIPHLGDGVSFLFDQMRGIRVRNPLKVGEKRAYLMITAPLAGYMDPELSMAVSRTTNGPDSISFSYRYHPDAEWIGYKGFSLTNEYRLIRMSLSYAFLWGVQEDLQIRVDFHGNTTAASGNVRINNLMVEATPLTPDGLITSLDREEKSVHGIRLYPTLTNGKIKIERAVGNHLEGMWVKVLNGSGAELLTFELPPGRDTEIDLHQLPEGFYVVHLATNREVTTFKVIKRH